MGFRRESSIEEDFSNYNSAPIVFSGGLVNCLYKLHSSLVSLSQISGTNLIGALRKWTFSDKKP